MRPEHPAQGADGAGAKIVAEQVERRSLGLGRESPVPHPTAGDGMAAEEAERHGDDAGENEREVVEQRHPTPASMITIMAHRTRLRPRRPASSPIQAELRVPTR